MEDIGQHPDLCRTKRRVLNVELVNCTVCIDKNLVTIMCLCLEKGFVGADKEENGC